MTHQRNRLDEAMKVGIRDTFTSKTFRYTTLGVIGLFVCPFIALCLFVLGIIISGSLGAFFEILRMHP